MRKCGGGSVEVSPRTACCCQKDFHLIATIAIFYTSCTLGWKTNHVCFCKMKKLYFKGSFIYDVTYIWKNFIPTFSDVMFPQRRKICLLQNPLFKSVTSFMDYPLKSENPTGCGSQTATNLSHRHLRSKSLFHCL